jgi:PilZ domain
MSIEKRRAKRRQISQRAWVDFGPGTRVQQCLVKDMSDSGARLALGVPELAPAEFVLQFAPDGSVGRRCEVRWQRGGDIGVKFTARLLNSRRISSKLRILDC